jgi:ATP-dependent exoDNAse (exonuclease V), alpha subunit - helicase superfamily I member
LIELTIEQQRAHDLVIDFSLSNDMLFTLGGYAGVGKTTVVAEIARTLKAQGSKLAFATFSGKASTVLRSKIRDIIDEEDYCGTIHSLIYRLIGKNDKTRELIFEAHRNELMYDFIIVDEASMVNEVIYRDLARCNIPILAVGDHGQLPPVKGSFNLMADPQVKLEKIMRQEEGNPIIHISRLAREGEVIPYKDFGGKCLKTREIKVLHDHPYNDMDSIMLCATNKTRCAMNSFAREKSGRGVLPEKGEPVICLYNNNLKKSIMGILGLFKI